MANIKLNYQGKTYTLEYNRQSVYKMEKKGFNANKVEEMPITNLITLFKGAFIMHHPTMSDESIEEIFKHVKNRDELIKKLMDLYAVPLQDLFEQNEEEEGNASWETGE